jgi:hypothetical protein
VVLENTASFQGSEAGKQEFVGQPGACVLPSDETVMFNVLGILPRDLFHMSDEEGEEKDRKRQRTCPS